MVPFVRINGSRHKVASHRSGKGRIWHVDENVVLGPAPLIIWMTSAFRSLLDILVVRSKTFKLFIKIALRATAHGCPPSASRPKTLTCLTRPKTLVAASAYITMDALGNHGLMACDTKFHGL